MRGEPEVEKCGHPDCDEPSSGLAIQGVPVCRKHIDWAMDKAFKPLRDALDE